MNPDLFDQEAFKSLMAVRNLLAQAERIHPDIPMSVLISLLAEAAMLNEAPDEFEQQMLCAVRECRVMRMSAICAEAGYSTRH